MTILFAKDGVKNTYITKRFVVFILLGKGASRKVSKLYSSPEMMQFNYTTYYLSLQPATATNDVNLEDGTLTDGGVAVCLLTGPVHASLWIESHHTSSDLRVRARRPKLKSGRALGRSTSSAQASQAQNIYTMYSSNHQGDSYKKL